MASQPRHRLPAVGIGFRPESYASIVKHLSEFAVLEIMVDHYIGGGLRVRERILELSRIMPVVGHGVGLSLGTAEEPDSRYLDRVAEVIDIIGAPWHSEHLAFTKVPGRDLAQLLPLPRTYKSAECVIRNIEVVRRYLTVPFALENIVYYFEYRDSEMTELEFIQFICRESGTSLLLDVENVYINSTNYNYDPYAFIDSLPPNLVKGIHVAGGTRHGHLMLDSHDQPVPDAVLELLNHVLKKQAPETVILERDERLEFFDEVLPDVRRLKTTVVQGNGK